MSCVEPEVCLRSGNNEVHYGDGGDEHEKGMSWMGFAWILRTLMINELGAGDGCKMADQLLLGTIANGAWNQPDAVEEVFLAAETDGLRRAELPHFEIIRQACAKHGLPVPAKYQEP